MKQYLDLVQHVLEDGVDREDRTGIGTRSVFGTQSRYDLSDGFPLVTTKKVFFSSIVKELLWFLSGSTNVNDLDSGIWDEWADESGDLGPIYGHQWRNWGGGDGDRFGIDQIHNAVEMIYNNPTSRRIIVSAWNVRDIDKMALPPCHALFQFYVHDRRLSCHFYQRSADLALGVPFNIASYALLTMIIAQDCSLRPGELVHTIGDAHIYQNHFEGLKMQLEREPYPLPTVEIERKHFDDIRFDDIRLLGYQHHPRIPFEIAV